MKSSKPIFLRLALTAAVGLSTIIPLSASAAVLWIQQAQRLQEVSATLLDTAPVAHPLVPALSAGLRSNVSFLPEANPRVGSKMESLPSSPVQTIPAVFVSAGLMLGSAEALSVESWAGYLPAGVEKVLGIKASLIQLQAGARAEISSLRAGSARLVAGAGIAKTKSAVEGVISSHQGSDSFTADSTLTFVSAGVQHPRSGVWGGLMIGRKKTSSRLSISEDRTDLEIVDTLKNARQPVWSQVSLGFSLTQSISVALSELFVPDRIEMPRLTFNWNLLSPSASPRE
jgi:hypothetical protein